MNAAGYNEHLNSLRIQQPESKKYVLLKFTDLKFKTSYDKKTYKGESYILIQNLELRNHY